MPAKPLKILSVRLPQADLRRIKSRAAAQGLTLQAAVREAIEDWMSAPPNAAKPGLQEFFSQLEGSLAGADVWKWRHEDKLHEWQHDRELGGGAPPRPRAPRAAKMK